MKTQLAQKQGTLTVVCGANTIHAEGVFGKTVGELRKDYADVLNGSGDAQALAAGQSVGDSHVLSEKDEPVEFVKQAGVKG